MTLRLLGSALLISITASGSAAAQQTLPPATALAEAEARWQARKPGAYEFEIYVTCFCPPLAKTRMRVVNGVAENSPFGSVEKLFELIRKNLSRGPYRIAVKYDPELGYPIAADLDPRREVADDELVFHVRGFRTLPVPAPEAEAAGLVRQLGQFKAALQGGGKRTPEEEQRMAIYIRLRQLGPVAIPAFNRALADSDVQVRRNVALYLGWEGGNYSKHAPEPLDLRPFASRLVAALRDPDERVKGLSAQAIAHLGSEGAIAVPDLLRLLADDSEGLRNSACIGLAGIGPAASAALPALRRALSDPSEDVRRFAQRAIDKITAKIP